MGDLYRLENAPLQVNPFVRKGEGGKVRLKATSRRIGQGAQTAILCAEPFRWERRKVSGDQITDLADEKQ